MSILRRRYRALGLVVMLLLAINASPADAASSHAQINGSGSSWAANAVNQWISDVTKQGLQVVFTSTGSAQGRKDFALSSSDYGVSDIAYQGRDPITGQPDSSARPYAYLPIVAGGTSFPYHLESKPGVLIRNLRLSGQTLAGIFTNKITFWDDSAIEADNNHSLTLPHLRITPVVHSEGSGSTAQFTAYLANQFGSTWGPFNNGNNTMTEYFPAAGDQKAQNGSDGVINFITSKAGNGSIGFDEYSYALGANYPVAKLLNKAGFYTLPDQFNVAVALQAANINNDPTSPNYLTQDLRGVYVNSDPRAYALSSYSYMIIPTGKNDVETRVSTTAKRQTVADFLYYSICQGQGEVGPIGYSSLPINLVNAGFGQIAKLKQADPGVDLNQRDVTTCNNPTFDKNDPSKNLLAVIAKQPPACDRQSAGPCATATGSTPVVAGPTSGANATSSAPRNGGGSAGVAAGAGTGTTGSTNPAGPTAVASIDPITGQLASGDVGSANGAGAGNPDVPGVATQLASASSSAELNNVVWALTVVLLLAVLIVPVLLARFFMTRGGGRP